MSTNTIQILCCVWGFVLLAFGKNGDPWIESVLVIEALKGSTL